VAPQVDVDGAVEADAAAPRDVPVEVGGRHRAEDHAIVDDLGAHIEGGHGEVVVDEGLEVEVQQGSSPLALLGA